MCFSASASFTSAALLSVVGVFTIKIVKDKRDYVLASFPFLFAVQQFIEGIIWLHFTGQFPGIMPYSLGYLYLLYAFVIWPLLVPLSVVLIEPHKMRRKMLSVLLFMGTSCALYLFYVMNVGTVISDIYEHNIRYGLSGVHVYEFTKWVYIFVVATSFFLSSHKWVVAFGVCTSVAFVFVDYFAREAYFSVWCFFAALLSLIVCIHLLQKNKKAKEAISSLEK